MRVLRTIFIFLFIFLLLGTVSFLILREVTLYTASKQMRDSVRELIQVRGSNQMSSRCEQLVGVRDVTYQIRFTTPTEYQLEAVCRTLSLQPVTISQQSLPPMVKKVSDTGGFILDVDTPGSVRLAAMRGIEQQVESMLNLKLSFLSREESTYIDENGIVKTVSREVNNGSGPTTVCAGYGYECCQGVAQVGVGQSRQEVLDCKGSCYQSCSSRPVVLSFNTLPRPDSGGEVVIGSGDQVTFAYVTDVTDFDQHQIKLKFGDGETRLVEEKTGRVEHFYDCDRARCSYQATISIISQADGEKASVETENTLKTIVVKR